MPEVEQRRADARGRAVAGACRAVGNGRDRPHGGASQRARARPHRARRAVSAPTGLKGLGALGAARRSAGGGHRAHAVPARERAARSARGRSRKSARDAPACSGTSRRCSPCSSRCTRISSIATGSAPAGSRRGRCCAGEWWRAVTALTVHRELDHLGGNLAFGAFFGYFVGRYLGSGVGWLAVLLAASGANALNAWVQSPAHRSIGASTAVFAALGMLVTYTWRRGYLARHAVARAHRADRRRHRPARVHGHGAARTRILGAHLFGFIAGLGAGLALARFAPVEWLEQRARAAVARRCCRAVARRRVGRRPSALAG